MHYIVKYENRKSGEVKQMGIVAKSEKQARFYFNSDETRRMSSRIVSVEWVDSPVPNTVYCSKRTGDFDDAGSGWGREYHYNRKKERGLL